MKSLIAPLATIVTLIVIFVIIDHKDFNRYDDDQTVQSKVDRGAGEPSSVISVGAMNGRMQSLPGTKLLPKHPPQTKQPPVAVPVATPGEAEQFNAEAIKHAKANEKRKDPFQSFYKNTSFESVTIEGTIRATSSIPDPSHNDYDNCLYALFLELNSVISQDDSNEEIPGEAILVVPIMKDKVINNDNIFHPGDMVACTCAEYDAMPQDIQEIQLSDDIQSFDHQQYYTLSIEKIFKFQENGNKSFAKRAITVLPIQTHPENKQAMERRKERIQNELNRIEAELKKHGGSFAAWKEEYKPIAEKYKKLCDEGYKGWIKDSYFSAIGDESTYNTQAYIGWILPYKKYLEENNIDLIILRYPSRSDFAARVLASEDFQENPAWVEHYYECLKNDIEIVDPMYEMWKHRYDYPMFYFYQTPDDIHPFDGYLYVAANVVSKVLSRYPYNKIDSLDLRKQKIKNNPLYSYPEGNRSFPSGTPIEFNGLINNGKVVDSIQVNTDSPFLFLGSSIYGYKTMQRLGASVPHYASYFLKTIVDWKYQAGTRNPMIRNLIVSSNNLHRRNAVIMVTAQPGTS